MSWRVLVSAPYLLPVIEDFRMRLEAEGLDLVCVPVRERLSEAELLPLVADIDGAICGDDQFTELVLRSAPRLKVISKWGTGIDSIDSRAAAHLGIQIFCTPNAFTDCVADSTLGYLLSFARRIPWMDHDIRKGLWSKPDAISLRERALGVVGIGNIGKAVVKRARAFGMRVIGNDPVMPPKEFLSATNLEMRPLTELLSESDFVTLHCDLNPTSFHLISSREFGAMRASAVLINTSRGPVVDEARLIQALRERRIAGAALDVFEVEPLPANSPLREFNNCLFGPHNANSGLAARARVHESTIANLLKGLKESSLTSD